MSYEQRIDIENQHYVYTYRRLSNFAFFNKLCVSWGVVKKGVKLNVKGGESW